MSKKTIFKIPDRLQGTDGIRREVRPQSEFPRLTPQQVFLKHGIITEEFMERYVYAHVRLTLKSKNARTPSAFVVAWDPRDPKGLFTDAVIRGVRKAGADAWVIGTAPTPLVPMFMQTKNAAGGFMVTASHNPKDQNGIKIFLAYRGLKLLPENDVALTRAVLKQTTLKAKPLKGKQVDFRKEALALFEQFHLSPINSWAENPSFTNSISLVQGASFEKVILVVDPARGALAKIAARVFNKAGFKEVHEVNAKQDGHVNHLSGVADLEGVPHITQEMIQPGGRFCKHKAPLKLFELGRRHRDQIAKGNLRVAAAVFDADGDRFYRMEYEPEGDRLLVLSGDETAYLQAKLLRKQWKNRYQDNLYIHTVESDLNTGIAAEKLGLTRELSPVGDKWILWRIARLSVESRLQALGFLTRKKGNTSNRQTLNKLEQRWKIFSKQKTPDISSLQTIEDAIETLEQQIPPLMEGYPLTLGIPFAVGSEETGHNITTGHIETDPGNFSPVHCGNGLKSALNTFAATELLFKSSATKRYFSQLAKPFTPGFKGTFYAYYIDQPRFFNGSGVWSKIKNRLVKFARANGYTVQHRTFPEDPDMLYISLTHKVRSRPASVFVRNSGTENKISVNLRGARSDKSFLCQLGEQGVRLLMEEMKDSGHPLFAIEQNLLEKFSPGALAETQAGPEPAGRVLMEMGKQGLVEHSPKGFRLTKRGQWYKQNFSHGENT